MQDVLVNLANRELIAFCKENSIDCSGTYVKKMGRGYRYELVREGYPITTVPYVSVTFTKNSVPTFTMDDDAKEQRAKKIELLRHNMPGYILGEKLTPFASDADVLDICTLNDKKAKIHNRAFERSKRG